MIGRILSKCTSYIFRHFVLLLFIFVTCLLIQLIGLIQAFGGGNQFGSNDGFDFLNSVPYQPSVVQLDFENYFNEFDLDSLEIRSTRQLINISLAQRQFTCILDDSILTRFPVTTEIEEATKVPYKEYDTSNIRKALNVSSDTFGESQFSRRRTPSPVAYPDVSADEFIVNRQYQQYLIMSKLHWTDGSCYVLKGQSWLYSICIRARILQFTGYNKASTVNNLGVYNPFLDQVYANGTVVQWYTGGTSDRMSKINYLCTHGMPHIKYVDEIEFKFHEFLVTAASFCNWADPKAAPPLEALLFGFEGNCIKLSNPEDLFFTYELCYPDSLIKYHSHPDTGKVSNLKLMGRLYHPYQWQLPINKHVVPSPSADFPKLRSNHGHSRSEPIWLALPMEIVFDPLYEHNILVLYLSGGSKCGRYNKPMQTTVKFRCPGEFEKESRVTRFEALEEISTCKFELRLGSTFVCAHPDLLPPREMSPTTVYCSPWNHISPLYSETPKGVEDHDRKPVHERQSRNETVSDDMFQNANEFQEDESSDEDVDPELAPLKDLLGSSERETNQEPRRDPTKHVNFLRRKVERVPNSVRLEIRTGLIYYGFGIYIRNIQTNWHTPLYYVGQMIQHRFLEYRGIVVSWDSRPMAPAQWLKRFRDVYNYDSSDALFSNYFYLIMVDQSKLRNSNKTKNSFSGFTHQDLSEVPEFLFTYVPESFLEPIPSLYEYNLSVKRFRSPNLNEFFQFYSSNLKRFIFQEFSVFELFSANLPSDYKGRMQAGDGKIKYEYDTRMFHVKFDD